MKRVTQRSENPETGVVHGLINKKVGTLQLWETVCEKSSGLYWLKANNKRITCMKCLSELPRDINDGYR